MKITDKSIIEERFIKAMETISLPINEALEGEEFEDIDEIISDVDINTKRRILHYENQMQRINDEYIKLWYIQGFKDGMDYVQKKNN